MKNSKVRMVTKRDGSQEEFNIDKIRKAIFNAFVSQHYYKNGHTYRKCKDFAEEIAKDIRLKTVEDIQDAVENLLMTSGHCKVAKAYILYREQHKHARIITDKLKYIQKYATSENSAADLSNTDSNANSVCKNMVTLESELYKDINRLIQRGWMKDMLDRIDSKYKHSYIKDLESHIIYQHDETGGLKPYCSAYSLYPLLIHGTSTIDGSNNHAPKHLSSFCGQFQNLVFLLSAQKKGAGAYGEFFNFFSYFCEKEWGKDYYKRAKEPVTSEACRVQRTIGNTIDQYFQSITHYINQPAGNRSYQSPFTNFNVFDKYYWHSMFDDFTFPDGSKPNWDAVNWLQKRYMKWLNKERTKTLLTFPVMTVCCLTDGKDVKDKEYKRFVTSQWAAGDSFFVYLSENADSIASCCRVRNEITNNTFSSTTGLTGIQTGSVNVITLNLNRIIQNWAHSIPELKQRLDGQKFRIPVANYPKSKYAKSLQKYIEAILNRVYDYQKAYKTGIYLMHEYGMIPQARSKYINLDKLYCTIGINGINEAALFLGYNIRNDSFYMEFVSWLLGIIKKSNMEHSEPKFMYNLELVPAESLGVKNYNWDKQDGYWVPEDRNLYNSYIYDAHDSTSVLDKIAMHGSKVSQSIDGGQASHINLADNLSKEQYTKLLEYAVKSGNNYITFNIPQTQCDKCGYIVKHPVYKCPKCGSIHVTMWTRVIGYLRPVKSWSQERREEYRHRRFTEKKKVKC